VNVPGAQRRRVQDVGTKNLTVGCDNEGILSSDLLCDLTYAVWLKQWETSRQRKLGHGRLKKFAPTAAAAIGLRDNEFDLVVRGDEGAQDGSSKIRSAGER
jgi:hypothetical protein